MSYQFRSATVADVPVLCRHRRMMFEDMGHRDPAILDPMTQQFTEWVTARLNDNSYQAWLALHDDGQIVAGAGLWLIDWPPHVLGPDGPRGYILNVYTEKEHRRQGLARRLTQLCIDACRKRQIAIVALHASDFGKSLYESMGFVPSNEMRLKLANGA
jgi:GNAT superfamily N-acetyltransferase